MMVEAQSNSISDGGRTPGWLQVFVPTVLDRPIADVDALTDAYPSRGWDPALRPAPGPPRL